MILVTVKMKTEIIKLVIMMIIILKITITVILLLHLLLLRTKLKSVLRIKKKKKLCESLHYENTPIQIYGIFYNQKKEKKSDKKYWYFSYFCQNIDCGYSLEPPRRGGSNEYPQSMFLSRNKKNNVYPCKPQFYYIKVGFKGVKII